ncbi:MAG: alpha-hydroxy-acid oxidizing protein [Rhizobiales bacterium]|nr:alpha-hydroxy-acid oxidizing protein [Hyphomicrobiales bacterium]
MPIETVAAVPGLRHWMQLYVFGADEVYRRLIDRALGAGSEALVLTTDGPVFGNRDWDKRRYVGPAQLSLRSRLSALRCPSWLLRMAREGAPRLENLLEFAPPHARDLVSMARWSQGAMRADLDWRWFAQLRREWPRKLLIKGVLKAVDVERARDAGADGVVLSNHGGRQLDGAIAPIEILADARRRVGPDFTILVDSGFRRGTDVVKALCLGADAVLLGRAALYGLAAGGEAGAGRALAIMRAAIDRTIGLLGARNLAELTPEMIVR